MIHLYTSLVLGVLGAWSDAQVLEHDVLYDATPGERALPLTVTTHDNTVRATQGEHVLEVRTQEVSRFGASACVDGSGTHATFAAMIDGAWLLLPMSVDSASVQAFPLDAPAASRTVMWKQSDGACAAAVVDALGTLHVLDSSGHRAVREAVKEVPDLNELGRGLLVSRVDGYILVGDDVNEVVSWDGETLTRFPHLDGRAMWPIVPEESGARARMLSRTGTLYLLDAAEGTLHVEAETHMASTTGLTVWSLSAGPRLVWADRAGNLHTFDEDGHQTFGNTLGRIRQPLLTASVDDAHAADVQLTGVTEDGALVTWWIEDGLIHASMDALQVRANGPLSWRHVDPSRPAELVIPLGNGETMVRPISGLLARPLEHDKASTSIYTPPLKWSARITTSPPVQEIAEVEVQARDGNNMGCASSSPSTPVPASGLAWLALSLAIALARRPREDVPMA